MAWYIVISIQEVEAGVSPIQGLLQLHWKVWLKQKSKGKNGKGGEREKSQTSSFDKVRDLTCVHTSP